MPRIIDTHAHLDSSIYDQDLWNVMERATQEDVWMVTVGNDYESSVRAVEIANEFEHVYAAIGLHPTHVRSDVSADDRLMDLDKYYALAQDPKVVAIGETGLDFSDIPIYTRRHPDAHKFDRIKDAQKKVLGRFLQLSQETRLPLLLHCRDAHEEMIEMLDTWDKATSGHDSRGIVHAFTGSWKDARRYFALNFMVSMTGIIMYGSYQTEMVKKMPLQHLVLESDCPYLTPTPWNLRRNEP
ncbi:TatD family hydrolase, partial [Patescibacteria group bacterium]